MAVLHSRYSCPRREDSELCSDEYFLQLQQEVSDLEDERDELKAERERRERLESRLESVENEIDRHERNLE